MHTYLAFNKGGYGRISPKSNAVAARMASRRSVGPRSQYSVPSHDHVQIVLVPDTSGVPQHTAAYASTHPVATTRPTIGSAPKGDLGPRRSLCKPVGTSRHTLSSSGTLASIETIRSLIVSPTAYTTTCLPSAPLQSFPPFGCASPPTDGRHQSGRTTSQGFTILSVSLRVANEQFTPFPVTCYPQRPASLLR